MPKNPCRRPPSLQMLCLALTAALLLLPSWAFAKGCIETQVGQSNLAPSALWGNALQPVGNILDATNYNGNQRADHRFPQVTSVDIENGYLFASYWAGIGIWDLHTDPEAPTQLGNLVDGWAGGVFPLWPGAGETDQYIYSLDAPEGDDSVVAVGGISPVGLSIFKTSNKTAPTVAYQDVTGKEIQQVFAATINGHAYAFAAGSGSGEAGVFIYDMTVAKGFSMCQEDATHGQRNCPGVYVGKISTGLVQVQYVHGMQLGSRSFIVMSAGLSSAGHFVKIYDVTNPAAPTHVVSGFVGAGLPNFTAGVAMWAQSGSGYLAVRTASTLNVYDVTACLTNGCSALPSPLGTPTPVARVAESDNWKSVVFSRNGSKPMLFLGNHDLCHIGEGPTHTEYVFDMSNPASPQDISPTPTMTYPTTGIGELVNYWSYYYSDDVKGFAFTAPRGGKFYLAPNGNSYLYRADLTLFDIHKWLGGGNVAPSANFTWSPSPAYTGDTVTFTDTSLGTVLNRSWAFPGGSPSSGTTSPINVTFATADPSKVVSLTVSNSVGPNTANLNVPVLNPAPAVANVTFTPANPLVCQPVVLTANGVTGKPTLTYGWNVVDANQASAGNTGTTNPFTWTTVGLQPGTYHATVTVHNGFGPDATGGTDVTLQALGTLALTGPPTNDSFIAGTVTFHAHATAATEWNWDFGDGQGYRGWTGPYAVPDPQFTYAAIGPKVVKVKIRNCITAEIESAALSVTISQITPLVASFQAECSFGLCGFATSETITFVDHSSGGPDGYFYDWNHNSLSAGTCSPAGNGTVQTTHTYTTAGTYFPCLRVTRGTESQVYVHPQITVSTGGGGGGGGGGNSATITIGGPGTGAINTPLTFAASSANCTPAATWSWNLGGGTISGSSTGSQVTISWPIAGTKTVTVTNLGCTGATGIKSVSVTDGSGGGGGGGGAGGLTANFTFNPAAPNSGQAVTFDASSSVGSPTSYSWDFGDGQTANAATPTASHTYAAAGSYTVKLDIGKPGASCSFGVCSAGTSKPITVAGGPPPLVATFDTSAPCSSDFAGTFCTADVGAAVTFTATTANATSYSWSFGDGGTASGLTATHSWTQPLTYTVQLTVSDGRSSASISRTFRLSGDPIVAKKAVILPWVAQTRGALVQTSDLYLLNPTTAAMDVTLAFIRRGNTPETNPPKATRTIQPGATLYVADVLRQLFSREDMAGFVTVTVDKGSVEPVLTAFNTTVQSGKTFGQTLSGQSWTASTPTSAAATVQVQNLVGLADNTNLLASVGVSNPSETNANYTMRLFDKLGNQIGTPHDFVVAQFGQRQYQPKDIQTLFGVSNRDDYRVEVRSTSKQIFPYSANLRGGTNDPSFVGAGSGAPQKVYLIGALSSPDALRHLWKSDVVLSNVASEVVLTDVSFIGTGVTAKPTAPVHVTLQPGETERMADVLGSQWSLRNTVGVITIDSDAPGGVYPLVQGESYDSTTPAKRFGQFMPAMTEAQAAGTNASHYLVGLRQDAKNRTVYWVFNPGTVPCVYDLVYRALDGHELGRISNVAMNPGIVRQFGPAQHKLPAGGATDGFTVQVQVKSGKVLAAAQVVNAASNDPAYIVGVTR